MAKVKVTIVEERTSTIDIGDFTPLFIEQLLRNNEGSFDGNYTISDFTRDEEYNVVSVEVVEITK